jgi:hypothetical protein
MFIGMWILSILAFGSYLNFKTTGKMTEIILYLAGFITLLFAVGFLLELKEMKKQKF